MAERKPSTQDDTPLPSLPGHVYAHGFSLNKRPILRRFAGDSTVSFIKSAARLPAGATLLLWGSRPPPADARDDLRIVRVEDGFLRSVGLGAELVRPLSWVMDRRGIYYDATRPSDLECLLLESGFSPHLLARAAALRERIVASRLTKYCVGQGTWRRPLGVRQVILVPGQVEGDASLRLGAPGIRSNLELLRAVRAAHPASYLLYKPHPDVMAGLRARGAGEDEARAYCDEVVTEVAMGDLLPQVDEVHVLTSLAGFEALLRAKPVVCHGQPFYAGWGLTGDRVPIVRRRRRLALDELVAGALIVYPLYVSRATGRRITVEEAVEEMLAWREAVPAGIQPWQSVRRALLRLTVGRP